MEIGEGLGRPILDHIRMLTFRNKLSMRLVAWEGQPIQSEPKPKPMPEGWRVADHLLLTGWVSVAGRDAWLPQGTTLYYQDVFIDRLRGACGELTETVTRYRCRWSISHQCYAV